MTNFQAIVARVGIALLAVINALSGSGVDLPHWVSAEGVNIFSALALAGGAAVHYVANKPAAPTEPTA